MQDQELRALADEIAKHLDGFTVHQEYAPTVFLKHPDGRELVLHDEGWTRQCGRIWVGGVYPKSDYRTTHFHITAAAERGGEAIAKDITRKLLPKYVEELAQVVSYNEREKMDAHHRELAQDMLVRIIPGASVPPHYPDRIFFYNSAGVSRGEVRLNHDGSSGDIELRSVSIQTLTLIAELLQKQYMQPREKGN